MMNSAQMISVPSDPNTEWDFPEDLTNGYIQHSIPHSKSTNLNPSEVLTLTDPDGNSSKNLRTGNTSKYMKKSFSVNTALTNFTKNSHWDRRPNPLSNSFSFATISSIFSTIENM